MASHGTVTLSVVGSATETEYVVWVTHTPASTHLRRTLPWRLAADAEVSFDIGADGMALCVMAWRQVVGMESMHQLVVIASVYLAYAPSVTPEPHKVANGQIQLHGPILDQTRNVLKTAKAGSKASNTAVSAFFRSCARGLPENLDSSYVFGSHKDPWFTLDEKWFQVPSDQGYPCLQAVTLTPQIWQRSVEMALKVLHQDAEFGLAAVQEKRLAQLIVITISALTNFAGMYNATPETTDDRKPGFMSMGSNGDCDDMSLAAAAVANYLIRSENGCKVGTIAHACWEWLRQSCSKAVVCLGYAVARIVVPVDQPGLGGLPLPSLPPPKGGGHCWGALLRKGANDLKGAWMLEGTRQTYNHYEAGFDTLKQMGLNVIGGLYDPAATPDENASKMKPLTEDQYQQVVYMLDDRSCYCFKSSADRFGASWADCRAGNRVTTSQMAVAPGPTWYQFIETTWKVPVTHVYPLDGIDKQCLIYGEVWERLSYGHTLLEAEMPAGDQVGFGHIAQPGEPVWKLGFGVSFAMHVY